MSRLPSWMNSVYDAPRQPLWASTLLGPIELVTPPAANAIAVERTATKLHLRIEQDRTDENALVDDKVAAAVTYCERQLSAQLLTATYLVPVAGWFDALKLPLPPLQSVAWVKYYDPAGTLQTLDPSFYSVRKPWRRPGVIERAPNKALPAIQYDRRYPIQVQFTCGYGVTAAAIPRNTRAAIMLMTGWLYRDREPTEPEWARFNDLLESEGHGSYG